MTNHYGNPLVTADSPRLFVFCRTNDKITVSPSHDDLSLIHSTTTPQKCKLPPTGLPSQHPGVDDFAKGYLLYPKDFVKGARNYNSLYKEEKVIDSTRQEETRRQEAISESTITSLPITTDKIKKDDPLTLLLQRTTEQHPLTTTAATSSISSPREQERSKHRPTHRRRRRNNHALCEDDFEKVLPELFESCDIDKN